MKYITTKQQTWMRDQVQTNGLLDLIKELGDNSNKRMVEIGSFVGESTVLFAQSFKEVIAIDPFLADYDPADPTSYLFEFKNVYETYLDRTGDHKNIKTIKLTSNDAKDLLKDELFDFIYIDGLHTYDGVKTDIINYLPLVKKGGVIGGHDYGHIQEHPHLEGVQIAVDEMLGKPDKVFADNSWIKYL
jgi:predicted O-methyltransferase YrrM